MSELNELKNRFGDRAGVHFEANADGIVIVDVDNAAAHARIALQGAHLMTWAPRTQQQPVIWLSSAAKVARGKSIRGGVPVCWPWFGPHASEPGFPAHGFARTVAWELVDVQVPTPPSTRLIFTLPTTSIPRAQWPHASALELRLDIGTALVCELVTRNLGDAPMVIGDALHTYFAVGDVRKTEVRGLDGLTYIDKVGAPANRQQTGGVTVAGEVDRIYLGSSAECTIEDPTWQRRIRIAKRGSNTTVVWNPWQEKATKMGDLGAEGYLGMLCVESANAADDVATIPPRGEHRLWVRYSVETLV